jgi:hypothetical protein
MIEVIILTVLYYIVVRLAVYLILDFIEYFKYEE